MQVQVEVQVEVHSVACSLALRCKDRTGPGSPTACCARSFGRVWELVCE